MSGVEYSCKEIKEKWKSIWWQMCWESNRKEQERRDREKRRKRQAKKITLKGTCPHYLHFDIIVEQSEIAWYIGFLYLFVFITPCSCYQIYILSSGSSKNSFSDLQIPPWLRLPLSLRSHMPFWLATQRMIASLPPCISVTEIMGAIRAWTKSEQPPNLPGK